MQPQYMCFGILKDLQPLKLRTNNLLIYWESMPSNHQIAIIIYFDFPLFLIAASCF